MAQELWELQVASYHDMMEESANISWKEPVYVKSQCSELEYFSDIACTLMARDYKGLGNQRWNGVIECQITNQ